MGKSSRRKRERHAGSPLTLPPWMEGDIQIRRGGSGSKISASLSELIEPYANKDLTLDELRKLVGLGVAAWNLSSLDESLRTSKIGQLLEVMGASDDLNLMDLIRELIERKLARFADDSRFVVSWNVRQDKNKFHISAAALIKPDSDSTESKNPQPPTEGAGNHAA